MQALRRFEAWLLNLSHDEDVDASALVVDSVTASEALSLLILNQGACASGFYAPPEPDTYDDDAIVTR